MLSIQKLDLCSFKNLVPFINEINSIIYISVKKLNIYAIFRFWKITWSSQGHVRLQNQKGGSQDSNYPQATNNQVKK